MTIIGGIQVLIYDGNYFDLGESDAGIMISTNNRLTPHRGISTDISNAAGCRHWWHCNLRFIQNCGAINVTNSITTSSGNLRYRGIIHSVFPNPDYDADDEQQNISYLNDYKTTIVNCLIETEHQNFRRIYLAVDKNGKKNEFIGLPWPESKDHVRFVYGNPSFALRHI